MIVDVMHLIVLIVAIGIGAWSLIAFRTRLPRGRFVIFTAASIAALFGCAALSGEVGLLPPTTWFAVVVTMMVLAIFAAQRIAKRASPQN